MTMSVFAGLVTIATFAAILWRVEVRLALLVAGLAGVNPIELTKRNLVPMLLATVAVLVVLWR